MSVGSGTTRVREGRGLSIKYFKYISFLYITFREQRRTRVAGPQEWARKVKAALSSWLDVYDAFTVFSLWSCGFCASIVQVQRQIHRVDLGRPAPWPEW